MPHTESPAERFGHPQRLLADTGLSLEQKRKLLDEWEDDVRAELVATEEGMTGPDSVQLSDIIKAKEALPIDAPPRSTDAKH